MTTIKLNDKSYEIAEESTLLTFLESHGFRTEGLAIAIDYDVIPRENWKETKLTDGMELMMIRAVCGGSGKSVRL